MALQNSSNNTINAAGQNSVKNLGPAALNGQPLIFEQLLPSIPAPNHTVPLTNFPRLAYYDTADGIIKQSRSDDPNKLCEMVVLGGTASTLIVQRAILQTAHGYPLGQALFVAATGGLTNATAGITYLQRVAMAPHANYLVIYDDPPRAADLSRLKATIPNSPYAGKLISALGDSITQYAATWPYLQEFTGASFGNYGVSGSCISWHPSDTSGTNPMQSPVRLNAISLASNLIFVFGGTNDYGANIPLGAIGDLNVDSSNSANTFYGGVNRLIDLLRTRFPFTQIAFITPTQRNFNYGDNLVNTVGFTLKQYSDAIVAACGARGVRVINAHQDFPLQRAINLPNYTSDGLHLDLRGHVKLQYFVSSNLCNGTNAILPPTPPYLWNVFDQSQIPSSDHFLVHSSNGIIYLGNTGRFGLFFASGINILEYTLDANTGTWIGVGGNAAAYTAVELKASQIIDFTPPTFSGIAGMTPLVSGATLSAMTRFRLVKDSSGVTPYGFDGTSFVQLYPKLTRGSLGHSGWASNYNLSTSDYGGQTATFSAIDGNWWHLKNVWVNGVPLYQAVQYGGV